MIKDFDSFCSNKEISVGAKDYINNCIRNAEPARRVQSRAGNVRGFYSSKKMGLTIQFESHTLELCAIYLMEFDENVFEFYDQPESFTINYKLNGKNRGYRYTADFFVISEDFIGWEEWKTEKELSKMIEESPERYILDESGQWRCPPAEDYAKKKGLSFRIRCSNEINWNLQNNIRFLEDYLHEENPIVSLPSRNTILSYIKSTPNITLDDLLSIEDSVYSADDIYKLIILGEIYVDLEKFLIINFSKFPLYINKETADAFLNAMQSKSKDAIDISDNLIHVEVGKEILWNSNIWTVVNVGETEISLLGKSQKIIPLPKASFEELIKIGAIKSLEAKEIFHENAADYIDIIKKASVEELKAANERYLKLSLHMDDEFVDVPERTLRDWKKKFIKAEIEYGSGYLGLISKNYKKGNKTRRISQEVIDLMNEYISDAYENKKQRNKLSVFRSFKNKCIEMGYDPPTDKTFYNELEKRPSHEQDKERRGPRAAYDKEPFYWELSLTTPRHGSRPFEIAHIDHTELDIELICSKTQRNLGRPWLTLLIDAFSRRVLAFYLTFDPPSYRSCMSTIRECIKKYSRMPKTIVVDGGKDFQSIYFDSLLAVFNSHKKVRPGAKPRFGSVCERMFGTTNTEFINNLAANTQLTKHVRIVTKEFNPKNLAIWTLEDLHFVLSDFLYEYYDKMDHTSLNQSPREAYEQNIRRTGERTQTYIKYDENFEMLTLPTTKKGTAKVQPGQGVKINNCYYNSYELKNPAVEGKQIQVRYDPYDYSKAYAYVGNYWVTLHSQFELEFEGRSQKEIQLATSEIRKRKRETQKSKVTSITASELAKFIDSVEAHELLEIQRLKDEAVRNLRVIDGGKNKNSKSHNTEMEEEKAIPIKQKVSSMEIDDRKENESDSDFEMYEEFF